MSIRLTPQAIGLTPESQQLLSELCSDTTDRFTYNLWKYMCLFFDVPRASGAEETIRNKLVKVAKLLNLSSAVDSVGNLVITKPPTSPDYANKASFIVQGHMDMVTSKLDSSPHNFNTDRINAKIVELQGQKWVTTGETTLGCDNGIGCAYALALLEADDIQHGYCYALFTVEEETTMLGAIELDPNLLIVPNTGKLPNCLINVDSEEEHRLCVGCAGGAETTFTIPLTVENTMMLNNLKETFSLIDLSISGLNGGHSGCDIHRNRGQAIKMLFPLLDSIRTQFGADAFCLYKFSAGSAPNVIPRSSSTQFFVKKDVKAQILELINTTLFTKNIEQVCVAEVTITAPELSTVELAKNKCTLSILASEIAFPQDLTESNQVRVMNTVVQNNTIDLGLSIKSEVLEWNKDIPTFVDTSNCFSIMKLNEKEVFYHTFARSTVDASLTTFHEELKALGAKYNAIVSEQLNPFPGWPVLASSPLLTATKIAFKIAYGKDIDEDDIYSIHAGLECGPIAARLPSTHMVSIGPTIINAHSPSESMLISSAAETSIWFLEIVKTISNVNASEF